MSDTPRRAASRSTIECLEPRTLFCEVYYVPLSGSPVLAEQGPMPAEDCPADLDLFSVASPIPSHDDTYGPMANDGSSSAELRLLEVPAPFLTAAAATPPAAPSNLLATKYSSSGIALEWNDNSSNESGFKIERKKGSGSWSQIATVGAGVTSYDDTGLSANTTYTYRVRAYNSAGNSAYSNTDGSTTLAGSTPSASGTLKWSTVASDPAPRSEGLSAVVGGKLYVLGGVNTSGPFARADVYDPASNSWKRLADLPKKLTHAGTTVVDGNIYLAGGYIGTKSTGWAQTFATRDVWRYNVDSDTYTALPQLPAARGSGVLAAIGRKLHFVSGADINRADKTDHWVLDLDNTGAGWKTAASIPNGKSHLAGVALNGKIYVIAGQHKFDNAAICQSDVHVYDPATDKWTKVANLPRTLSHHSSSTFAYNGRIYVMGGETSPNKPSNKVSVYDPGGNKWTDLTSLPGSRTSGEAGVINGVLYFSGGSVQSTTWKGVFG